MTTLRQKKQEVSLVKEGGELQRRRETGKVSWGLGEGEKRLWGLKNQMAVIVNALRIFLDFQWYPILFIISYLTRTWIPFNLGRLFK